ncbi:MAG: GNAT family N-acetyltransferase [Chloroflexota bacterium]|nr:GNAT family N-acetyltransferase [Chloroflexota bacterium]
MNMKVNLRRATPDDARALARVHVAAWHEVYRGIVPDSALDGFTVEGRAELFRQFLATDSEETYVAEFKSRILGFLTIGRCRDSDVNHGTTGEIWGMYLSPEYWHKGIGRFLCIQGESMLASRGYTVVILWVLEANDQARRFYEAMGFRPDGATKEVQMGISLTSVRYRKKLEVAEQLRVADADQPRC